MNLLIITERVYNILDNKYQTLRYVDCVFNRVSFGRDYVYWGNIFLVSYIVGFGKSCGVNSARHL